MDFAFRTRGPWIIPGAGGRVRGCVGGRVPDPDTAIESRDQRTCRLCGAVGTPVHIGLEDRLLGVPGRWSLLRCRHDGLWWLDPQPLLRELPKLYAEYHTHEPSVRRRAPARRAVHDWIRDAVRAAEFRGVPGRVPVVQIAAGHLLALVPGIRDLAGTGVMWLSSARPGRLLDIGSGSGEFIARMRDCGWNVLGIEPDVLAAQSAARRYGVRVVAGTLDSVSRQPGWFDAVTLRHVIEHVPDPIGTLRKSWDLLRPNGKLVVLTPNVDGFGRLLFRSSWRGLEPPRHLHLFSPDALTTCARLARVQAFTVRTVSSSAHTIWQASHALAEGGGGGRTRRRLRIPSTLGGVGLSLIELFFGRGEELLLVATRNE